MLKRPPKHLRTWSRRWLIASLGLGVWCLPLRAEPKPAIDSFDRLMRLGVLQILREGNTRFADAKSMHPHLDSERRHETVAEGQEPFATVLACSDSREPVELIFDRGIGDLFVVRVAGNVAGPSELASLEFGVVHLETPLLVVLGHTKCGAVTAVAQDEELPGHLPALANRIRPAVIKARTETVQSDEVVPRAIKENVWQAITDIIQQSREIRDRVTARRTVILGAVYDLESGKVTWLGPHPDEKRLLSTPAPEDGQPPSESPQTHSNPAIAAHSNQPEPEPPTTTTPSFPAPSSLIPIPVVDPVDSLRRTPLYPPPPAATE